MGGCFLKAWTLPIEDWVTQGLTVGAGEGEPLPVAGDGLLTEGELDVCVVEGCEVGVNPHHPPAGTRHISTPFR